LKAEKASSDGKAGFAWHSFIGDPIDTEDRNPPARHEHSSGNLQSGSAAASHETRLEGCEWPWEFVILSRSIFD
jgi:hypothetical protein